MDRRTWIQNLASRHAQISRSLKCWPCLLSLVLLFAGFLYPLAPRTPEEFIEISLNLQNNRQYSVMSEYFLMYYQDIHKKNPRFPLRYEKDLKTLITGTPLAQIRIALLERILAGWKRTTKGTTSVFSCLLAEIHLHNKKYDSAYSAYTQCKSSLRPFYLGIIEKERKNWDQSIGFLENALKLTSRHDLRDEIFLSLAFIHYQEARYTLAAKNTLKSRPSLRRSIILYKIYSSSGDLRKAKLILRAMKKTYADTIALAAFLETLKK